MIGRLYADEDFPFGAVQNPRSLGHDVLTVQEAGRMGKPDSEVLADGRAVLTHNHRHFQRLHARNQPHGGVISCTRDDNDLPGLANRIHDSVTALQDLTDRFVRVIRPIPRVKP